MRRCLFLVLLCVVMSAQSGWPQVNPTSKTPEAKNPFTYDLLKPPEICFFPPEKARWNGYTLTNKEWKLLTVYQKTCFVTEAIDEIQRQSGATITLDDKWRVYIALNRGVEMMEKELAGKETTMLKFLLGILQAGKTITFPSAAEKKS